ncbi:hypothetical protein BKA58DRAFT_142758 [Alternaria rosae]|uniref:uncharacterized protein n=1 Tax=Alternaria rosae TaxID=1187941 RepID=UPI001E8ED136|nr:uncharacterized protein BKA58DRAFT_142758 [Alternaria rosae]KAH6872293.1 hypothetical protein BKA58DRAFT_142758 [Alternaria rosae]
MKECLLCLYQSICFCSVHSACTLSFEQNLGTQLDQVLLADSAGSRDIRRLKWTCSLCERLQSRTLSIFILKRVPEMSGNVASRVRVSELWRCDGPSSSELWKH